MPEVKFNGTINKYGCTITVTTYLNSSYINGNMSITISDRNPKECFEMVINFLGLDKIKTEGGE